MRMVIDDAVMGVSTAGEGDGVKTFSEVKVSKGTVIA